MRGHIAKKGDRYYVVVELGRQPARRCESCGRRHWESDLRGATTCTRCKAKLIAAGEQRRQQWQGGFRTKKEAQRVLTDTLGRLDSGSFVAPKRETVMQFFDRWFPAMKTRVRSSTWDSYERNYRAHILPELGHVQLQQLTPALLNSFYARMLESGRLSGKGGLSPRTVRYLHTIVHRALADAVRWGELPRNVADAADPPRRSQGPEMLTWAPYELRTFLEATEAIREHPAFLLAGTTGMRRGEVLGLRWRDVDLDRGTAEIRQALSDVHGGEPTFTEPKTKTGRRSISLDKRTVTTLRTHRTAQLEERFAWGPAYRDRDLVFCREDGSPVPPDAFSKTFKRWVGRLRLPYLRFHDLRHTWATLALRAGVHPKVVSERLGHSTVAFTLDVYSHAIPAMQAEAADAVAALVFGGEA